MTFEDYTDMYRTLANYVQKDLREKGFSEQIAGMGH